jgi:DNA-binding beta-propeller fold protein YncE
VATLGELVTIDRRSGDVVDRAFVGFGVRPLTYDPRRNVVYVGNFLRGDVVAFDVRTGTVTRRWFGGRYLRDLELTRDGTGLLVTSNLGVVRIDLDGRGPTANAP